MQLIQSRVKLTPKSVQILNTIKAVYDLKDRSEALNMYIEINSGKGAGNSEMELVARKIIQEKAEMTRKGERYLTEDEALRKYR